MEIAKQLKDRRAARGLTQAEAAVELGVSVRTLQGWERGDPVGALQVIEALEGAIRVLRFLDPSTDTNQESASG